MWNRAAKIVAVLAILGALAGWAMASVRERPTQYYLSPEGSDENDGSFERPWQSLSHALDQLRPGDVLSLRGGRYFEHEIAVDLKGSAAAPITIQSYPGERAIIDGGIPDFQSAPNTAWELVNPDIQLYRSRRTFHEASDFAGAWLLDDDVQLVQYESAENLESTNYGPLNGLQPFYMGPGVQLRADGHIYIRLTYNPNDLTDAAGNPLAPTPSDTNPNNNRLAIFFSDQLFTLEGASHLHFKDLDFAHARYLLEVRQESQQITLSGSHFRYGNRGILIRDGATQWEISNCEFSNGVPDYLYWTDVKNKGENAAEAYPEFQSVAIDGSLTESHIHHNLFRDAFDGLRVEEGTRDTRITDNILVDTQDDAINLSAGISNVEVAHNMLRQVMSGISNLASDAARGHVYIHHNVIDNASYRRGGRPGNYREDNWPAWRVGAPFPDHDNGDKAAWWKLYNNTIVTRQDPGHRWSAAGPDNVMGNPEKHVLNNIFYVLDERVIFRDDLVSFGSHYDGNVVYRNDPQELPLFSDFGDGGRYDSLLEFQTQSGTEWEQEGLEVDPGFGLSAISDPAFDPLTIWERYRPSNSQLFGPGASYEGYDWPESEQVDYRGAVPPESGQTSLPPPLEAPNP